MKLAPIADLQAALDGRELVGASAGPDGALWALAAFEDRRETIVVRADEGGVERVCAVEGPVHFAQPLGDEIVMGGARCRFHGGKAETNARRVTRDGRISATFTLGDGIAQLLATFDGQIWCSYFDEGVFGNYGWGEAGGPPPIGASGLCAFDTDGALTFSYDANAAGTDVICDCYALNVADDDSVWLYFYSEFSLVHLRRRRVAGVWRCPIRGSHAFAVAGDRLLMAGGYDAHHRFGVYHLEKGRMVRAGDRRFIREDGVELGRTCFGRGSILHFLDGPTWYRVDLHDLS